MATETPSRKRKRVSKNKKKNWGKTDIKDVEELLESKRIQERTGGLAEDKPNEQLFYVDKKVDTKESEEPVIKRKRKEPKPLKCHALLQPDSKIKPVTVSLITTKKKKRKGAEQTQPSKKQLDSIKERKLSLRARTIKKAQPISKGTEGLDLWGEQDINVVPAHLDDHYVTVTKIKRKKPPVTTKRQPSELAAIETPLPGQSYNPAYDDHQDLLQSALDVEKIKVKKDARIKRALDDAFPTAAEAPTEATYINEMSAGLYEVEGEKVEEDSGPISVNPPVRRQNKKTERQRKKQEERKKKAAARQKIKEEKIYKHDLFRLKSLKSQVIKEEQQLVQRLEKRAQKKDSVRNRTRKLGRIRYEEPSLDLKLSHELQGSLRLLRPEGHLLQDRYKSLQKRNILEPRQKQRIKLKFRPKTFEKNSFKAVVLPGII